MATKLHIGCGKKLLPGYLNCDVEPERPGIELDAEFNVLDGIPFDDETADEILMVHVWEHLYKWDHPRVTAECLRVLRPGGQLVLELPDILKCCANYLALYTDMEPKDRYWSAHFQQARAKFFLDKRKAQHSEWGMFSDHNAAAGREHMMHHSGWRADELCDFLLANGFSEVVEEPPLHKGRRLLRDMRIVATK